MRLTGSHKRPFQSLVSTGYDNDKAALTLSEGVDPSQPTVFLLRSNVAAMKFLSNLIMSPLDQLHPLSRDTNALV
jgi:hypothetical protein